MAPTPFTSLPTPTSQPADRTTTYLRIVAALKSNKTEPKRICFTVGGNRIDYKGNVSTPTADLMTVKCLLNSVVSTNNAEFMTIDIKDFYLNTPMNRYEYMRIPVKDIPATIMTQYKLQDKIHNGTIMVKVEI
jgi:hypothetical protein